MVITARSNEKVRFLRRLFAEKKLRQEQNVYIAEGFTLVGDIPVSCEVKSFFVRESENVKGEKIISRFPNAEVTVLSDSVFDSVSDTVSPSGIIALVERNKPEAPQEKTVLVLDGISDAGNMGTIIRTASACGVRSVVCLHSCCDPFAPKSVRASMGGVFYENIIETTEEDFLSVLKGYRIFSLDMGGKDIFSFECAENKAIVVGNEAHGISDFIRACTTQFLAIPMVQRGVESLNASVAAGIAMYMIKKGE